MTTVKHKGTPITLGGKDFILPPMNVTALKMHDEAISKSGSQSPIMQMKLVSELALLALRRNYPDITTEFLEDVIDLGNFEEVFRAVVSVSGFVYSLGEAQGKATA